MPSLSKFVALCSGICLLLCGAQAQHIEIGGFGDYENVSVPTFPQNAFGLGGHVDVHMLHFLYAELETAYDFKHANFVLVRSGASAILTSSKLGVLHANAGVKLQTRGGSFFLFVKGGANRYDPERTVTNIAGAPIVISATPTPQSSFTKGIFYPGLELEANVGALSRADIARVHAKSVTHISRRICVPVKQNS